jgi:hypothetical protein
MSNTRQKYLRFIHVHRDISIGKNINGITIAYARSVDSVQFAWAVCIAPDQYQRSIGRKHSTDAFFDESVVWPTESLIDPYNRIGVLGVEYFINPVIKNQFSPNFVKLITVNDFSYSAIESRLVRVATQLRN